MASININEESAGPMYLCTLYLCIHIQEKKFTGRVSTSYRGYNLFIGIHLSFYINSHLRRSKSIKYSHTCQKDNHISCDDSNMIKFWVRNFLLMYDRMWRSVTLDFTLIDAFKRLILRECILNAFPYAGEKANF